MADRPRALIVGAGIGGLAAALALSRAGLSVVLLERASELRELGFALMLAPNAMRALRMLGVAERILAEAEVAREGELRTLDGHVLKRVNFEGVRKRTGEDTVCAQRHVVHGSLLAALEGVEVRTGASAVGFEHGADGVELALAGGERLRAEMLVAADGANSTLRGILHSDALRSSDLVAYRGMCRGVSFAAGGAQYFGRGIECGVGRAGGGAVYWYASSRQTPALAALPAKAAALELLSGCDLALMNLVEHTAADDVRRDELFDREPLRRWGEQRVTLLGDAAHPMLPHAGQGAAQAIEDAVVLGRCVAEGRGDLTGALRRYERARIPRTTRIVRMSRFNARIGSLERRWICALRDWLLEHGPAAMIERQVVSLARVEL